MFGGFREYTKVSVLDYQAIIRLNQPDASFWSLYNTIQYAFACLNNYNPDMHKFSKD